MTCLKHGKIALILSAVALASCDSDTDPVQPSVPAEASLDSPAFAAAVNAWTTKAPMPTPRGYLTAGVASASPGALFYAIGGWSAGPRGSRRSLATVEAYDLVTNTWTTKAPLPVPLSSTNGLGVIGRKLYVSGGENVSEEDAPELSKALYVYDPSLNLWSRKADMPLAAARGITGVIDNKLYVLTGLCSRATCSATNYPTRLWLYDPSTNRWNTALRRAPTSHESGAGGVIDGKFYVVGGGSHFDPATNRFDVYDPATNTWTQKAPLPRGLRLIASAVVGNRLYILGGVAVGGPVNTLYMYNPVSNRWVTKAAMPTRRYGVAAARVLKFQGQPRIVAVGGHGESTPTEVYTP